jgi:hypothetical protein
VGLGRAGQADEGAREKGGECEEQWTGTTMTALFHDTS